MEEGMEDEEKGERGKMKEKEMEKVEEEEVE